VEARNSPSEKSQPQSCKGLQVFNSSIRFQFLIFREVLMRRNIKSPKTVYSLHEVNYTVLNTSLVQSICNHRNLRGPINCITKFDLRTRQIPRRAERLVKKMEFMSRSNQARKIVISTNGKHQTFEAPPIIPFSTRESPFTTVVLITLIAPVNLLKRCHRV
jgi:hypothetical protein